MSDSVECVHYMPIIELISNEEGIAECRDCGKMACFEMTFGEWRDEE